MSSASVFPEGAALLYTLFRGTNGELGAMFDLKDIPPKKREIERKYEITGSDGVDHRMTTTLGKIAKLLDEQRLRVERFQPFVGIDQYWVLEGPKAKATFRYRFSANVLPELTAKVQLIEGMNEQRAEFDLDLRDADVQNVRAFMATVCLFAPDHRHFCIRQSGHFWKLLDSSGRSAEVVLYKAGLLRSDESRVFTEIEARNFEKPEEALASITDIEAILELQAFRCEQSIAELFE
jgi:CYTH domain-containing protein